MNGEKKIIYTMEFDSSDVNKLMSELAELLIAAPSLSKNLPTLMLFANMLNKLLSKQDYNPENMVQLRKDVNSRGFKSSLLEDVKKLDSKEVVLRAVEAEDTTTTKSKKSKTSEKS